MRKFICILILMLPLLAMHAQRRIMLYDPELNQPIRNFKVWTDKQKVDSTNIFGEVVLPEKFDTLLLSKPGYIALRIPAKLVEDTIPVIKDYNRIGEVVVYGSRSDDFGEAVRQWTREEKVENELKHPITGIKFDMSELLSKRRRRDKRNAKKMAKIFQRMDEEDDDPIIHSYRRAMNIEPKH